MPNKNLSAAKSAKNDEFYTQFADIQKEVNAYLEYDPDVFRGKTVFLPCDDPDWSNFTKFFAQNFEAFGLKKLISTSYALDSKPVQLELFPSLVEEQSGLYDAEKSHTKGKLFILDHDTNANGRIDFTDLQMTQYLDGDGDFRSDEVKRLRDEADIIVTNPPFSLFREFMAWIFEANKKFLVIGNMNAITYKEIFPLIMHNKMWLGPSISSGDREFAVPKEYPLTAAGFRIDEKGNHFIRVKGVRWFTNMDHGRRHQPLSLMTITDNNKFSRHKEIRGIGYHIYENFDGIEIPFTDATLDDWNGAMNVPASARERLDFTFFEPLPIIPRSTDAPGSFYVRIRGGGTSQVAIFKILTTKYNYQASELHWLPGIMGVPISFLDKFCPDQFEIVGQSLTLANMEIIRRKLGHLNGGPRLYVTIDGELKRLYDRILIRLKTASATF